MKKILLSISLTLATMLAPLSALAFSGVVIESHPSCNYYLVAHGFDNYSVISETTGSGLGDAAELTELWDNSTFIMQQMQALVPSGSEGVMINDGSSSSLGRVRGIAVAGSFTDLALARSRLNELCGIANPSSQPAASNQDTSVDLLSLSLPVQAPAYFAKYSDAYLETMCETKIGSSARYDKVTKQCTCAAGYSFNDTKTSCIKSTPQVVAQNPVVVQAVSSLAVVEKPIQPLPAIKPAVKYFIGAPKNKTDLLNCLVVYDKAVRKYYARGSKRIKVMAWKGKVCSLKAPSGAKLNK